MDSKMREAHEKIEKALSDVVRYSDDKDLTLGAELGLEALALLTVEPEPCASAEKVALEICNNRTTYEHGARLIESYARQYAAKQTEDLRAKIRDMQHMIGLVLAEDKIGGITRFRLAGLMPPAPDDDAALSTHPDKGDPSSHGYADADINFVGNDPEGARERLIKLLANECWPVAFVRDCFDKYDSVIDRLASKEGRHAGYR